MSLQTGITTGTCAAAAAKAAAMVLAGQSPPVEVVIDLPSGDSLRVPILYARRVRGGPKAVAAVRKDAGDDPDVTNGLAVVATVWRSEGIAQLAPGEYTGGKHTGGQHAGGGKGGIQFLAGDGVGTVTKPGLQIPPGEPAINPVPRRMIESAVRQVTDAALCVEISIPGGAEVAERTFNPRLGIVGGLSILGTTGIVRPYCTKALHDALTCVLDVASACGVTAPVLVPGNIGASAAGKHFSLRDEQLIEVGNEWGFVLDRLADHPFTAVLLVGHPGKLAKLPMLAMAGGRGEKEESARGDWDTHSSRSASATGFVAELFAEILHRPAPPSPTVEGIFASLAPADRRSLGDALAGRITAAVAERVAQPPPAVNVAQPPPAVNVAQPPPAVNVAQPPPAVSPPEAGKPAASRPLTAEGGCATLPAVASFLVTMSGECLGTHGDFSPWR